MKIILKNEKPQSWNQMYSGVHWSVRKIEAERVHWLVRSEIVHPTILKHPVDIIITAYFKQRALDPDNICCKLYIDGLKGLLLEDDTSKYVKSVKSVSLIDKQNPRVEIELL